MKVIWIIILSASLLTVACLSSRVPFSALPVPPAAELSNPEGSEEMLIDLTQSDIRDAVKDKYGRARIEIYALPVEVDWGKITEFYVERLKGSDWQTEPKFSRKKGYYQMIGWSWGPNQQALVIAYLEKPKGAGRNYLLVALAPEGDS